MSYYSQYIYHSQKESKHSGLEILVVYVILGHFALFQIFMRLFVLNIF